MQQNGEELERGYRSRKVRIMIVAALLSGLSPLVIGIIGEQGAVFPVGAFPTFGVKLPLVVRLAIALTFIGGLLLVARWNWQSSDEVRRSHLLSFWAAIGISVSLTFLGFAMFGNVIPAAARLPLAFIIPIALGLLFAIARWMREGYVW